MNKNNTINENDLEIQTTNDGSTTISRKETGLLYRSAHGALQESKEVFVKGANLFKRKHQWNIFELGFGTGMNFSTTCHYAKKYGVRLHYEAVDHLPVPDSFATCEWGQKALALVRESKESASIKIPMGTLTLHPFPFQEVHLGKVFDAVYHDPFGPSANPDCWKTDCFVKEAMLLSATGIWTSYGASGAMRRALAQAGLFVAVGPSVGRKRETTLSTNQKLS